MTSMYERRAHDIQIPRQHLINSEAEELERIPAKNDLQPDAASARPSVGGYRGI